MSPENPELQSVLNQASTDKFLLVLDVPQFLKDQKIRNELVSSITPLEVQVFGSVVPAISVPSVEVRFGGQSHNVSSHNRPNYAPLNVNFVVDNRFRNYYIMWKWLDLQNGARDGLYQGNEFPKKDIQSKAIAEYQTNFSIFSLDEYNVRIAEFKYFSAFITGLGAMNYNYRDSNIIESSATFQFSQFDMELM